MQLVLFFHSTHSVKCKTRLNNLLANRVKISTSCVFIYVSWLSLPVVCLLVWPNSQHFDWGEVFMWYAFVQHVNVPCIVYAVIQSDCFSWWTNEFAPTWGGLPFVESFPCNSRLASNMELCGTYILINFPNVMLRTYLEWHAMQL